jgi:hypothetical protein
MPHNWWTPRNLIFAVAIALLACAAATAALGLAYPEPVSSAGLGPDWQCSRLAFVWTTCSRLKHAQSASARPAGEPACRRPRT